VTDSAFARARDHIYRDGRLLERRLFAALFENGPADAVVDCLRGYQNEDGGFGQALDVTKRLRGAEWFLEDAGDRRYGLRPLAFAPTPDSRWRTLFSDEEIEAHLRAVAADQEEDGGWPLRWEPPSDAARCEWRGFETLQAIRVLVAYGRASP
jgi:hypothetical protein